MKKSDLLSICKTCPEAWKFQGCIVSDLESSDLDDLSPPPCVVEHLRRAPLEVAYNEKINEKKQASFDEKKDVFIKDTSEKTAASIDEKTGVHRRETDSGVWRQTPASNRVKQEEKPSDLLDSFDLKIMELLLERHYESSISRITGRPRTTIQKRINRLKTLEIIKPEKQNHICFYMINPRMTPFLVHDERPTRERERQAGFTLHCSAFKFPLISGLPPTSKHPIKMRNWTGYDFKESHNVIRIIPKWIIVFVNEDLKSDSVENLNAKYRELAISIAGRFAEAHGLKLGAPKEYQTPHFTLKDNALAKALSDVGEFQTESGIHIDKSRSSGDLEMDYEAAKAMEYSLIQRPKVDTIILSKIDVVLSMVRFFDDRITNLEARGVPPATAKTTENRMYA
ncbi:Uncharacterised protein [uncultured archaeon]|nr:Uncharacterised protein [uncultured archaeon]